MSQGNRFEMVIDSFGSYPDVQPLGYVQTKGKTNYAIQTLLNLKGHQLRMQRHILYGEFEHPRPNKLVNVGTWGFPTLLLNTLQFMMYGKLVAIKREPVVLNKKPDQIYGKFSLEETNFREKVRELIIQSAHKNFNSTIFDKR